MKTKGPSEKTRNKTSDRQRIFNIRGLMISRCYDPQNSAYKDYGGRGITVCDKWLKDKEAFYEWSINILIMDIKQNILLIV